MTNERNEMQAEILRVTQSVVLYVHTYSKFGGYEGERSIYTADIAHALYRAGYRKQSENMVSVETVKKWLYEMAINNVGCVLDGDFSVACEEIISRLDGLIRFAEEMKGGAK